ncbi:MAG: AmmeMemoRadiSam system protein B [Marinilabiliaceae bacterium]
MEVKDRKPAVAGMFYEGDSAALEEHLQRLFDEAKEPVSEAEVAAVIVPHAGYVFSGGVAASAFNQISPDTKFERVFLIGSSHRMAFEGASVYTQGDYITPLGKVEVDREVARHLVESSSVVSDNPAPHKEEHSLEVELPFLQHHLKHPFKLVPIMMGPHDASGPVDVAHLLEPWFKPGNLFVISTDFSHYPPYEKAREVDSLTAGAILSNDPEELNRTLEGNKFKNIEGLATSLCGWTSVLTLMHLTKDKDDLEYVDLEYKNSGDSRRGDKDKVVGYHAISVFRTNGKKKVHDNFSLNEQEKQWLLDHSYQTLRKVVGGEGKTDEGAGEVPAGLKTPAGAFVSLYKDDKLQGCIGHFGEDKPLYKVVEEMTRAAALDDPRFSPVSPGEIEDIKVEISVLTPMRKVDDVSDIKPGKHGILIKNGSRSGTFLPQVADKTGWNREELLGHCARDKAGLSWDGWKDSEVFVYEAIVFSG